MLEKIKKNQCADKKYLPCKCNKCYYFGYTSNKNDLILILF